MLFSILMCTYNSSKTLKNAIDSVICQACEDWELVILDNGSTDETVDILREYQRKDERVKYCKLEENGGQAKARNYGIKQAKYDYIAFEDSDDIWHLNKLEIQMQALTQAPKEVGFVYHKIRYDMGNHCTAVLPAESVELEKKIG